MSKEEKNQLGERLSAALNPVKIENPVNLDPVTRKEITDKKTLSELKVEIKFHLNQMAGHAIEIGKLLIEAKEQVGHGEWYNWLEENFNLKRQSAQNFMNIAERFGANHQLIGDLNYTQMVQMLALPAGEEEKFIEEKAAEGNPVEDMTVKNLREEIKSWKEKLARTEEERDGYKRANEIADEQLENLDEENQKLKLAQSEEAERLNKLLNENIDLRESKDEIQEKLDELQNEMLRKETVEVAPADYETTKKELEETKAANEQLQKELKELQEKPIDVAVEYPSDYESIKVELEELKEQNATLKNEYEAEQKIKEFFLMAQHLTNYVVIDKTLKTMTEKNPVYSGEFKMLCEMLEVIKNDIEKFLTTKNGE